LAAIRAVRPVDFPGFTRALGPGVEKAGQCSVDEKMARKQLRLNEGNVLAETLLGMTREQAIARATEMGFDPEAIPATAEAVTADLRVNRVRMLLDESERFVRAWAG
jgi:hypothetical protein